MIMQALLVTGLFVCIFYALIQRNKSRLISVAIAGISIVGIYFVVFPADSTKVANILGIGRGADLVLYCWIVISLVVSFNLQLKILKLRENMTELARDAALRAPRESTTRD